ncbi:MAG: SMC family ATPase, partial [Selenomonadaceae bacterium]|nr:SMC family ATPase [Selenomonadaceae bacterium]
MRPIRLKLEAFGPYVDELEIDFERELGGENFFLIHGVTGSGKTSLLDAMCFALYGDSSGGGRDGTMMRSEQAGANHATYVEFTFALRDKIYRVRRTPRYERAKARGTGTTTVNADAELYKIEGGLNVLLTNGASKVTTMISELIGFKCDQFRQVIVLPQGDFKRFLMAGSKDRE